MGIFKTLFKKVNPQKVFDTVAGGIGGLIFTDQERAEFNANMIERHSEFVKDTLSENSIRSRTRRVITYIIVGVVVFLSLFAAFVYKFDAEYASFIFRVAKSYDIAFTSVIIFFFGSHAYRTVNSMKKDKKK